MPVGEALFESILVMETYPEAASLAKVIERASGGDLTVTDGLPFYSYTHYPVDLTAMPSRELLFSLQHSRDYLDDAAAVPWMRRPLTCAPTTTTSPATAPNRCSLARTDLLQDVRPAALRTHQVIRGR